MLRTLWSGAGSVGNASVACLGCFVPSLFSQLLVVRLGSHAIIVGFEVSLSTCPAFNLTEIRLLVSLGQKFETCTLVNDYVAYDKSDGEFVILQLYFFEPGTYMPVSYHIRSFSARC